MWWGFVAVLAAAVQHQPRPNPAVAHAVDAHIASAPALLEATLLGEVARVPAGRPAAPPAPPLVSASFLGFEHRATRGLWSLTDFTTAWVVACVAIAVLVAAALAWYLWPRVAPAVSAEGLAEEERVLGAKLLAVQESRRAFEEAEYEKAHPIEAQGDFRGLNTAIDRFVQGKLGNVVDKVRLAAARKEKAQRVLVHRYEVEAKRTMDCLRASAQGLVDDVRGLADLTDEHLSLQDDLPPVAMVCAGLVAPVQLYALVLTNRLLLCFHLVLVVFDATVLVMSMSAWTGWDPRCPGAQGAVVKLYHQLWWLGLHCGLHAVMLGTRVWAEWKLRVTYARISERKAPPSMAWAGSLGVLLQSDIDNPRALYLFDTISGSYMFQAASLLLIADFALNIVGVLTFFTERAKCSAGLPVNAAMQTYGVLFALFFLVNLVLLALFVAYKVMLLPSRLAAMLRSARQFDAVYMPIGMPVLSLVLRAFVFRDVSDRHHVESQCLVQEGRAIDAEEEALLSRVEGLRAERAVIETARRKIEESKAGETEDEFTEQWLHSLEETFAEGQERKFTALFRSVRADVEASVQYAMESDAAHKGRAQAKAAYERAEAAAAEALSSEPAQAAAAQAKAAYDLAHDHAERALQSEAAQKSLSRAKSALEQAQAQAQGVLESEEARAAVARASEAYDQAHGHAQAARAVAASALQRVQTGS